MAYVKFKENGHSGEIIFSPAEGFVSTGYETVSDELAQTGRLVKDGQTIRTITTEELDAEAATLQAKLEAKRLKYEGIDYVLGGTTYKIPLTKEAQDVVTTVTVGIMNNAFNNTVLKFDNGTSLPISDTQWMAFATWFAAERNKQFV